MDRQCESLRTIYWDVDAAYLLRNEFQRTRRDCVKPTVRNRRGAPLCPIRASGSARERRGREHLMPRGKRHLRRGWKRGLPSKPTGPASEIRDLLGHLHMTYSKRSVARVLPLVDDRQTLPATTPRPLEQIAKGGIAVKRMKRVLLAIGALFCLLRSAS